METEEETSKDAGKGTQQSCPQPTVFTPLCLGKDLRLVLHFVTSSQQTETFNRCFSMDVD